VWLLKRLAPYQRLSNEEIRQQAAAGRFKHIADDFCLALINERERLAAQKLNEPPRFLELVSSRESGSRRRAPLTKSGLDPKESAESEESEEYNARAGAGQKPRSSVVVCPDSSLTCGSHEPIRRELRELTKAFLYLQGDDLQEKLGSQLYSTLRAVLRVYIEGVELDRGTDVAAVMKELDVSKRRAQEIIADLRRRMRALLSDKLRGETARRLLHLFGSSRNNFVLDRVF
jgi:hypothetical protein